jgi:hypothetical protein
MDRKSVVSTLLASAAALLISCAVSLPSGDQLVNSQNTLTKNELKKDGEVTFPLDYRNWHKFVSTVERADKEEVREIYINSDGMKGTEADGFPYGTTFVMEIFAAKRATLVLTANDKAHRNTATERHIEVYVEPPSLLLPTDAPGRCHTLSAGCGWSFMIKDTPVDTGIHVPKGAAVRILSTGSTRIKKRLAGVSKDALLCKVGDSDWSPCNGSANYTPEGSKTLLRTREGQLIKGRLLGLFIMQKGPDWGRPTGYETGDWIFDHYRPLVGQLCVEPVRASNGPLRCVPGRDTSSPHERVLHENWGRDCRRCHTPAMEKTGSHDRDFVYGYEKHFKMNNNAETKHAYSKPSTNPEPKEPPLPSSYETRQGKLES